MPSAETQINVFTLNCWQHRSERINAITRYLENSQFDIIALQELWVYADYNIVRSRLSKSLPFSKFFHSGALGAGLAIHSRFPIVAATIHPYSLNGSPLDVLAGDWFVGKAAASILITHPSLGQVQVFNTHLFAKGGDGGPEHHRAHRLVNAWEFAKLAKQAAELGRYVIAAGDFNSIPTSLPMTVIRDHASLSDAWEATHPPHSSALVTSMSTPTPSQAIEVFGVTADSPLNTYSAGKHLDVHARAWQGKRLDYIFYRDPAPPLAPAVPLPTLVATSAGVLLTDAIPGFPFSYSDHFGVSATLQIKYPGHGRDLPESDGELRTAQKQTPHTISALSAPAPVQSSLSARLAAADANAVLGALTTCYHYSRTRARRHLFVFGLSVGALTFLVTTTSWFSSGVMPFVVLGGAAATWLGTTMLYVGFVYGRWEINALMNVIEELELYRKSVEVVATVGELDASIKP
ncbi:inositol phosphophingolipids phospholipase C [Russula earlei]|uniref:Inositol phosphophingolipids phospholipase C n=1 Tax=Russula earlei TaxID=71964 RepID=A0ACC0UB79_9AGAM|nr:inositol phosphophingolipids phospholipase C [Russula earlei]